MKRKVLMIVNYFYPEVAAGAQLMTELCEQLQSDFELTVIAAFPNYVANVPEEYKGKFIVVEKYKNITILRIRVPNVDKKSKISRLKYMLYYFINSVLAIMKSGKQDLIFAISQPPILGGILGNIAKRIKKAKLIYNIQDFSPEVVEVVGYFKHKGVLNLARSMDNSSCKAADVVLLVGRDMKETLKNRFVNHEVPNNVIINNWIDENTIIPLNKKNLIVEKFKEKYGLLDKFIFMYSGNIGLYYDLENIIKVIAKFKDNKDILFAFVGDGAMKGTLVDYCYINHVENIRFIPYQSKEELLYSLNAADVHMVTSAKGIKGISVPSKIYGVMAVDKPVLGILEKGAEARMLIEESGCGYCCDPGEYIKIEEMISKLIIDVNENVFFGRGREYIEKELTKDKSMIKYKELFLSVIE